MVDIILNLGFGLVFSLSIFIWTIIKIIVDSEHILSLEGIPIIIYLLAISVNIVLNSIVIDNPKYTDINLQENNLYFILLILNIIIPLIIGVIISINIFDVSLTEIDKDTIFCLILFYSFAITTIVLNSININILINKH